MIWVQVFPLVSIKSGLPPIKQIHNDFKSKYYLHFLKEPSPKYVIECLGIISLDYGIEIGLTQFGLSQYMDIFLHY